MAKRGTALQMEIVSRMVRGMKPQQIAEELNCNTKTIYDTKGDPALKRLYYEKCNEQIEELLPLALQRLKGVLTDDSQQGSVHIAAIREVLDRSHLKELLDADNKHINVTISYE